MDGTAARRGWQAAELLMAAGGALACAAALGSSAPGTAMAVAPAGLAAALVAWRMRRLDVGRLRVFYACAVGVFGLTTLGQGYLRLALHAPGSRATDAAWAMVVAGMLTAVGAGGRLLTSAERSRYSPSE